MNVITVTRMTRGPRKKSCTETTMTPISRRQPVTARLPGARNVKPNHLAMMAENGIFFYKRRHCNEPDDLKRQKCRRGAEQKFFQIELSLQSTPRRVITVRSGLDTLRDQALVPHRQRAQQAGFDMPPQSIRSASQQTRHG